MEQTETVPLNPDRGTVRLLASPWLLLSPVTAFWLSFYSLPLLIPAIFMVVLVTAGYGVVLVVPIWMLAVLALAAINVPLAFGLWLGEPLSTSGVVGAANMCVVLALVAFLVVGIGRGPSDPLVAFTLPAALWYGYLPWRLGRSPLGLACVGSVLAIFGALRSYIAGDAWGPAAILTGALVLKIAWRGRRQASLMGGPGVAITR